MSTTMPAYPLCACGHRHDHHRHHAPVGCWRCEGCEGYAPARPEALTRDAAVALELGRTRDAVAGQCRMLSSLIEDARGHDADAHVAMYSEIHNELVKAYNAMLAAHEIMQNGDPEDWASSIESGFSGS